MKKEIIVNRTNEETRVAILEDGKLMDLFIERRESEKIVGNIYKGKVNAVLPGISSSFVNIGLEKNAYLFVDDVISPALRERKIEKMLSKGQDIIVQIDKEPISTKGAKTTMDVSLPGRLLVFMPFNDHIGISKNIEDRAERDRLKKIIDSHRPEHGGFIVRTEAEDATDVELKREMKYLERLWQSIKENADKAKPPALLHRDLGVVFQTVRDYLNEEVEIMLIDNHTEFKEVKDFTKIVSPECIDKVQHYSGRSDIFKAFKIDEEIKQLYASRVDLPSGGSLIIQEAESLCAIDVNTGRFTGNKSQEETVTITNLEAAKAIARQIRLRSIGGIIVIDFIDMKHAKNRQKVLEALSEACKNDKAKIKIWPITRLGLIEMTRERRRESFSKLMSQPCPECGGTGQVVSSESLFIQVIQELQAMKLTHHAGKVRLRLNPAVAQYFRERIGRLRHASHEKIEVQAAPEVDWAEYNIIVEQ